MNTNEDWGVGFRSPKPSKGLEEGPISFHFIPWGTAEQPHCEVALLSPGYIPRAPTRKLTTDDLAIIRSVVDNMILRRRNDEERNARIQQKKEQLETRASESEGDVELPPPGPQTIQQPGSLLEEEAQCPGVDGSPEQESGGDQSCDSSAPPLPESPEV